MKRRPNFSTTEMDALIDGVAASREVVASACPGRVSKASKEREWQAITWRVNETSTLHRTIGEVRKKWKNLRMVTKAKREALLSELDQACRSSGGGSGSDALDAAAAALKQLTPAECRVIEILEGAAGADAGALAETCGLKLEPSSDTNGANGICNADDQDDANDTGEVNWSVEEADLELEPPSGVDRSEIILTRHLPQSPQQLPATQALTLMPTPALVPAGQALLKPSILTVVETLQRRLLADAEAAAPPAGNSATTTPSRPPTPSEPAASIESRGNQHNRRSQCCCCCSSSQDGLETGCDNGESQTGIIEHRLLRFEERRLRLEADKLAAMREIVVNLREIAGSLALGNGAATHSNGATVAKDASCQTWAQAQFN